MVTTTTVAPAKVSPTAGPEQAAIEIDNLVVTYGSKRAVDGLSLKVPAGSIFGFLGPNGAGKTTTIKTLLGLRKPDAGSARVLGHDIVAESTELRAHIGYVSEANSLYDHLTVREMNAFYRSTARKWDQAIFERYIQMFGLPVQSKVKQLSNGMKRQLALSLAMGNDPDLLILDEPTSGLDPIARHDLLNRLTGEIAAEGKTVFFCSHILSEVEAVADWIGIIKDGKLVISDELDHLKQSQKVLKLVFAEAPSPAEIEGLKSMAGGNQVEQEGRSVRIVVRKDVDAVAGRVREAFPSLRDLDIVDLNLEDLFLEYMKEDGNGR
jgi:ABC-2 type transport system ATP-binding protein